MHHLTAEALRLLPHPTNFVQVPIELIRRIGPTPAILLSRMHWRFEGGWRLLHQHGDHHWWTATLADLAEETGLSTDQVRGALKTLVDQDFVVREKHRLGGPYDQSYSYRVRTADEATSLLPTDVVDSPHQQTTDVVKIPNDHLGSGPNVLSLQDLETHNTDSVGGDEEPVDKSGPFRLTPARRKLVTDTVVAAGQAYAVQAVLDHLEMQTWGNAEDLIERWCGVAAAVKNGLRQFENHAQLNYLLGLANIPHVTEAQWQALLAGTTHSRAEHGAGCHYDETSGYCQEHGLRPAE